MKKERNPPKLSRKFSGAEEKSQSRYSRQSSKQDIGRSQRGAAQGASSGWRDRLSLDNARSSQSGSERKSFRDDRQDESQPLVLCGIHSVIEALKSEQAIEKIIMEKGHERNSRLSGIFGMARNEGIPVVFADKERLSQLARNTHHQGVIAILSAGVYQDPGEILLKAKSQVSPIMLLLNSVQDPHNLGSLLRTADAFGVAGIVIPKRRSAGLSPGAARASAGAMAHVPVARVSSLAAFANTLKKEGYWIVGADSNGATDLWNVDISGHVALMLGGEDEGLSKPLLDICDVVVRIPMCGKINSLNVGVSGAICLFEILRIRQGNLSNRLSSGSKR